MRVLILGAGGQLGTELISCFPEDEVIAAYRSDADLAVPESLQRLVLDAAPDLVVNCAAMTAVDRCEAEPELAEAVNATAVGVLAASAGEVGAHLVTISTDYVFDGEKVGPYLESDIPNPQSAYGRSKLRGELLAGKDATIVRTAWVCSRTPPNMVLTVLRLLEAGTPLRFVDDQIGSPTFAADLAVVVAALVRMRYPGVVHATNVGSVSWFDFVQEIARQAGFDPSTVEAIRTDQLDPPRPAPRPANSVLRSDVLPSLGIEAMRPYEAALAALLADLGR